MTAFAEYREPRVGPATGPTLRNTTASFGTQSYCDCGTAPGLSMGGVAPYTLEAWIKPRSVTGGFIVGKLSEGSLSIVKGHLLAGRNAGDRGVGSVAIRSTTVLETGRWYHVATTFDGMSLTLYVNGRPEVSARALTRLKAFSSEATLIGAQKNQERLCNFFLGLIGEVRIWNVSRTAGQMLTWMDTVEPAASGLVAHYGSWSNPAGGHVNHS
jgi:hypothetical protein